MLCDSRDSCGTAATLLPSPRPRAPGRDPHPWPWHRPAGRSESAGMDPDGRAGQDGEFTRLDRRESLRLLATVPVGRLIFTVNALPAVRPMNFALVDELILVRTAADSTVARKVDDMIVAFEADELDTPACPRWSLTVTAPPP